MTTGLWYVLGFAFAGATFVLITIGAAWVLSHRSKGDHHTGLPYEVSQQVTKEYPMPRRQAAQVIDEPEIYAFILRSIRTSDKGLLDNALIRTLEGRFQQVASLPGDEIALVPTVPIVESPHVGAKGTDAWSSPVGPA